MSNDRYKQDAPQAFVTRCDEQPSIYWPSTGKPRFYSEETDLWPKCRSVPADTPKNKPTLSLFRAEKIP
jgi:hypothetical protein